MTNDFLAFAPNSAATPAPLDPFDAFLATLTPAPTAGPASAAAVAAAGGTGAVAAADGTGAVAGVADVFEEIVGEEADALLDDILDGLLEGPAADPARALLDALAVDEARTHAAAPADTPAQAHLDDLMARVGVDGLVAAHELPGLLATLDQHAAAVRDALTEAGRTLDAESLSSYARSITFAATRAGQTLPEPGSAPVGPAWLTAGWHATRLVAICLLADTAGLL
jgi:hypothetical protein